MFKKKKRTSGGGREGSVSRKPSPCKVLRKPGVPEDGRKVNLCSEREGIRPERLRSGESSDGCQQKGENGKGGQKKKKKEMGVPRGGPSQKRYPSPKRGKELKKGTSTSATSKEKE